MPFLLAILGALGAAAYWYWNLRNAGHAASDLADAANDVRLAARRFNYRRRHKTHPVDSIDDPRLAAGGIIAAIGGMDSAFDRGDHDMAVIQCQSKFNVSKDEADEIMVFGEWVAGQCGTKDEAVRRLCKRLFSLSGAEAGPDLVEMVDAVAKVSEKPSDSREAEAMARIRRTFFH